MLNAKVVVVGFNHHFGFNKEGDYKQLWEWQDRYSFEAEEIPEQEVQHETVSSTKIRQAIGEGYIQRANAYLDHYYIIIGKVEEFNYEMHSELPPLVKISLSEECKLLPSPGIYAVSVENGNVHSKGMVIIHRKPEEKSEVLLNIFDKLNFPVSERVTLYFHKKIHGAVNLSDSKTIFKINLAKEEISDLIY
jgi:riboflavin kinase/FMN adenylyltransferase